MADDEQRFVTIDVMFIPTDISPRVLTVDK